MENAVDGDYQYYSVSPGDIQRELWVENNPQLADMMNSLTDAEIHDIKRGGQDPKKLYAAFAQASESQDSPTVVLVKTVKGDGMTTVQGTNTVHQKKNLNAAERIACAQAFEIPLSEDEMAAAAFYRPAEDSPEIQYLKRHREALGGFLPNREVNCPILNAPPLERFREILKGSGERPMSTTTGAVRLISRLLKDADIGRYVVPIVPDEARTFGMDALFNVAGIYSSEGQKYTPVDQNSLLRYKEASDGQILQEGICETGAMASFLAAGTAYAMHGIPTIPFYLFYSIFGFQRVGDMIWTCGDMMCRGFLLGGTAGRSTLNGEGLQHQDGHSQVVANTIPNLKSYDPAFTYELAIIIRDGIDRMYAHDEKIFYYIPLYNEAYVMPALPEDDVSAAIVRGMYRLRRAQTNADASRKVHLLASGSIMQQALASATLLEEYGCAVDIWSVTSFNELYRDAVKCTRWNRLHPAEPPQRSHLEDLLAPEQGVFIGVSDYMKAYAESISQWVPGPYQALGTDGFGLSESREQLRDYFEIGPAHIALAALDTLRGAGEASIEDVENLMRQHGLDAEKINPVDR